jgi:hypothetical protein
MLAGVLHPDFSTINVVLQRESKNIFTVSSPYTKRERERERESKFWATDLFCHEKQVTEKQKLSAANSLSFQLCSLGQDGNLGGWARLRELE